MHDEFIGALEKMVMA